MVQVDQVSGGDKPHPYLFGETSFVVAGFIPAWKGQLVEEIAQLRIKGVNAIFRQ
jgi:hypothetical protein